MAAKKIVKMDVQLKCSLGRGGKDGKPGDIVSMPEDTALILIRDGLAVEPLVTAPADSGAAGQIAQLEQTVADLRGELAALQEDCTAKLDQAKAYASALEERCKAAGVDIADLTGTGK
ncbi:hypothetical protein N1030_01475 [Desulfovibrio mangrovi]|uniref:hypothetical protein n=1 Tax=Desulfovibrio mangrovi TaxID=2976983 RepID=UPI002246EC9D|nr:hypothetical protein [Desulfovibrio mangrovi]UZP67664.1 hypothetical protein N1030_01475 [Desulfovibrio mangrovi]